MHSFTEEPSFYPVFTLWSEGINTSKYITDFYNRTVGRVVPVGKVFYGYHLTNTSGHPNVIGSTAISAANSLFRKKGIVIER